MKISKDTQNSLRAYLGIALLCLGMSLIFGWKVGVGITAVCIGVVYLVAAAL